MNLQNEWTVYRTRFLVRARQLTEPLVFTDALGREQSGRPGDYLVETSEGIKRITTRALFEDIYVPVSVPDNNNGARDNVARDNGAPGVLARHSMKAAIDVRVRATA